MDGNGWDPTTPACPCGARVEGLRMGLDEPWMGFDEPWMGLDERWMGFDERWMGLDEVSRSPSLDYLAFGGGADGYLSS